MCGRYSFWLSPSKLKEFFDLFRADDFPPRYNIAPTQTVPVVRVDAEGQRVANNLRWGLLPFWAKSKAEGSKMINCRSETAATKPAFRHAFKKQRCIVPATGFFEWQEVGPKETQPYYLTLKNGDPAAFAGLWGRSSGYRPPTFASPAFKRPGVTQRSCFGRNTARSIVGRLARASRNTSLQRHYLFSLASCSIKAERSLITSSRDRRILMGESQPCVTSQRMMTGCSVP